MTSQTMTSLDVQTPAALQALVDEVLDRAKKRGVDGAEVSVSLSEGYAVEVRQGEVETLEYNRDKSMSLCVYQGQRSGTATTSDLSPAALASTVDAACSIATYTQEDPYGGLPEINQLAQAYPDCDLYHPWGLTPQEAIAFCQACEGEALAVDKRITNSEGVSLNTMASCYALGNSLGFNGVVQKTRHSFSCVPLAQVGDEKQRDYEYTVARAPEDLMEASIVAKKAAHKVLQRLGARQVPTCAVPVLFAAPVARGLLQHFIAAISGGSLYRRASFLLDQVGKAIFPQWFHMKECPHLPRGLASAPFDGEGVRTTNRVLVDNGILQGYVLGSYSARKLGLTTTGNAGGIHNCVVENQDYDLKDLLKKMDRGFLVTELMGQGVNIVTGDYSRGATGFWVENGEIQYPVNEVTIAGSLPDMFRHLVAVGNDVDRRGAIQTGSILIEEMMVGGI
ncbi:MAG: metalloprotease PmbA [Gammaproteobacteria bacterium]